MNKKICFFLSRISDIRDLSLILSSLLKNDYKIVIFLEEKLSEKSFKKFKNHGVEKILNDFKKYNDNFLIKFFVPESNLLLKILRPIFSLVGYINRGAVFNKLTKRYSENNFLLRILYRLKFILNNNFVIEKLTNIIIFFENLFFDKNTNNLIINEKPDQIFITPLLFNIYLSQNEIIKCAKKNKISCTYIVRSWDNLSNKSIMTIFPDNVIVWNDFQKEEVQILHKNKYSNIFSIGAHLYEYLYSTNDLIEEKNFKSSLGLSNSSKKIVTYLGSSKQIIINDVKYLINLAKKLSQLEFFKNYHLIFRPHPLVKKFDVKRSFIEIQHLIDNKSVIIYPDDNDFNNQILNKQILVNTIYNSDVLLGVNTSVMVEANYMNKISIIPPMIKNLDDGLFNDTYHSKYLMSEEIGGTSIIASDFEDLIRKIKVSTTDDNISKNSIRSEKFKKLFLQFHMTSPSSRFLNLIKEEKLNFKS